MKKLMMAVGACVCALGAFATQIYKPTCGEWPKGYTQFDYLESSGKQYIDTGIAPKATTRVVFGFAYQTVPTSNSYSGWGSVNSQEAFLFGAGGSGNFTSIVSSNWKGTGTGVPVDQGDHVMNLVSGSQKLDGNEYGTTTIGSTASSEQTMYLFASRVEWSPYVNYYMTRLSRFFE